MKTICKTVAELKAALAKYPDDMPLWSMGCDVGGYDSIDRPEVIVAQRDAVCDHDCKGLYVGGPDHHSFDGEGD